MKRLENKIHTIIFISILILSVKTKNYCEHKKCTSCSIIGEDKSCNECAYSKRQIVENKKSVFKCGGEPSIDNCIQHSLNQDGTSNTSKCIQCESGYKLSSESEYCVKIGVDHCLFSNKPFPMPYINKDNLSSNSYKCQVCQEDYQISGSSCWKSTSSYGKIDKCLLYTYQGDFLKKKNNLDLTKVCYKCKKNYIPITEGCVRDEKRYKCWGYDSSCQKCNWIFGWFSIGVDSFGKQICEYSIWKDLSRNVWMDILKWIIYAGIGFLVILWCLVKSGCCQYWLKKRKAKKAAQEKLKAEIKENTGDSISDVYYAQPNNFKQNEGLNYPVVDPSTGKAYAKNN